MRADITATTRFGKVRRTSHHREAFGVDVVREKAERRQRGLYGVHHGVGPAEEEPRPGVAGGARGYAPPAPGAEAPVSSWSMARRTVSAIALAWLVTIAIDFAVFGGLFAGLLEGSDHPGVLEPEQLFARIPAGYVAFLLEVVLLWLLLAAGRRRGIHGGLLTGTLVGLLFASAVALGVWSFSTVPVIVLVLWWFTLLLQFAAAGAVLAAADTPQWPRARTWAIWGALALVVAGVVLQNVG